MLPAVNCQLNRIAEFLYEEAHKTPENMRHRRIKLIMIEGLIKTAADDLTELLKSGK